MTTRERIYSNHRDGTPALYTERREDGLYLCDENVCERVADEAQANRDAREILTGWLNEGFRGEIGTAAWLAADAAHLATHAADRRRE